MPPAEGQLSVTHCDATIDHMKTATVRDLRYRFPEIEARLREGEEIQISKRKRVIARLVPERQASRVAWPDFFARLQKMYGRKRLTLSGAELLAQERDRY